MEREFHFPGEKWSLCEVYTGGAWEPPLGRTPQQGLCPRLSRWHTLEWRTRAGFFHLQVKHWWPNSKVTEPKSQGFMFRWDSNYLLYFWEAYRGAGEPSLTWLHTAQPCVSHGILNTEPAGGGMRGGERTSMERGFGDVCSGMLGSMEKDVDKKPSCIGSVVEH